MNTHLKSLGLGIALAIAVLPGSAMAGQRAADGAQIGAGTFRTPVRYGDLDLTTVSGRKVLEQRARASAHAGCAKLYAGGTTELATVVRCQQLSAKAARVQIGQAVDLVQAAKQPGVDVALNTQH